MIKNMNINKPRTKLNNFEKSKGNFGANLSQPKLNEMHCISYGVCEQETRSDLCF